MRILFLALPVLLSGCVVGKVASTAVDVATIPVKVASAGVDAATTSQSEADEKRGRRMRKAEEKHGRALRDWQKACDRAERAGRTCPPRPEFVAPR